MEKQARRSLNHGLESSRKAEESWRVLAKALKWGRAKLPGFRIGGHAEEWCWGHLEGSKRSGGEANLSFFPGSLGSELWASRDNGDNNKLCVGGWGRSQWKRRVGASREMDSDWGRGGLYL